MMFSWMFFAVFSRYKKINTSRDALDYADYESVLKTVLSFKVIKLIELVPDKGSYISKIKLKFRNIYSSFFNELPDLSTVQISYP